MTPLREIFFFFFLFFFFFFKDCEGFASCPFDRGSSSFGGIIQSATIGVEEKVSFSNFATILKIADFLSYHHLKKLLIVLSVRGPCSACNHVISLKGMDPSGVIQAHEMLQEFISFLERPPPVEMSPSSFEILESFLESPDTKNLF